jgi:hypothetical protein
MSDDSYYNPLEHHDENILHNLEVSIFKGRTV